MSYCEILFWIFVCMIVWAPLFTIFYYAEPGSDEDGLEQAILNLRKSSFILLRILGFIFYIVVGKINRWIICLLGIFYLTFFMIWGFYYGFC